VNLIVPLNYLLFDPFFSATCNFFLLHQDIVYFPCSMQVLKFGGTSVESAKIMTQVASIVEKASGEDQTVVVMSAMKGVTDQLIEIANEALAGSIRWRMLVERLRKRHVEVIDELFNDSPPQKLDEDIALLFEELIMVIEGVYLLGELSDRTKDRVAGFGELLSTKIFSGWYNLAHGSCTWVNSRTLIVTDKNFGKANVDIVSTNDRITGYFNNHVSTVYIVPGFIASTKDDIPTTLGRGGSDYTAALIGAAMNSKKVEIWTDVSGMMTADPRMVSKIKQIPLISYKEAMELSHFGAKVIYPPTIRPLMEKNIPVWIKNSFKPDDVGTLIFNQDADHKPIVVGISSINKIVLISLEGSGMVGIPGFSKRLFEALAAAKINVVLITQSSSEHSICVGIEEINMNRARLVIHEAFKNEMQQGSIEPLSVEKDLSIVALVGDNMQNHTGVSGRMFSALGKNGINIRAIAQGSSERNISTVISTNDVRKAVNVIHEEFFETSLKQVNLFIAGTGNVGKKLIDQLLHQRLYLQKTLRLNIRIVALMNSKNRLYSEGGVGENWEEKLPSSPKAHISELPDFIKSKNLRNSIFVDVTASDHVARIYPELLNRSIAIVACNKVAASSEYEFYKKLKMLSAEFNAPYLFETNVGAGLPVIGTLNDLMRSGDSIHRIEAVLSGTLNFVFNHYDGTSSFASVVRQAQQEGYTEPDPRLDLSGTDVMRKIMILSREAGALMEMDDIRNHSFLPESAMKGNVDDFYKCLEKEDSHFRELYEKAKQNGNKLKFVASYVNGKASVGLREIDPAHDFYHLYGKDNIVLFYSSRYNSQPMVIKGAGAGADVTASGVFADIIRAASN